jgi:mitochondrial import inner membrane translocase subunit TIM22
MKNAIGAGFATGALIAARAGPKAMIMGGTGFAAFSAVIEILMPHFFE